MTGNYGKVFDYVNELKKVNAHTNGGGRNNDLTVEMDRLARFSSEDIEAIESFGFEHQGFHTGDPIEHDFTALLTFKETDDHEA